MVDRRENKREVAIKGEKKATGERKEAERAERISLYGRSNTIKIVNAIAIARLRRGSLHPLAKKLM